MRSGIALFLSVSLFAGCAGSLKEMQAAQQGISAAQAHIDAARQSGAPAYANDEFMLAQADAEIARDKMGEKKYDLALTFAQSSDEHARTAQAATEEAKAKEKKQAAVPAPAPVAAARTSAGIVKHASKKKIHKKIRKKKKKKKHKRVRKALPPQTRTQPQSAP